MSVPVLRSPLFRTEAMVAQRDDGLGVPLTARSPGATLLTASCVALVLAGLVWATTAQYGRKAHVRGVVAASAGAVRVVAVQTGVVAALRVAEGSHVSRGQAIAVVSSERSTAAAAQSMAAAQQELRSRRESLMQQLAAERQIESLGAATLDQRIQNLERQAAQAADQVELQRRRVTGSERNLERQRVLHQSRFISESALQQKEEELLDLRSQLGLLSRNASSLDNDLAAARAEAGMARLKAGNAVAALRRQISELDQQFAESEERREVVLTAPVDGVVTTVLVSVGQSVGPAQPMLTIMPVGATLDAQLLVPTRAAAFVHPGQTVAMRYDAFPYQSFGHAIGVVTEVGRIVVQAADVGLNEPGAEAGYRVMVRLPAQSIHAYGQWVPLRHGMAVDADVVLDRQRLVDWLFEPLRAVSQRL